MIHRVSWLHKLLKKDPKLLPANIISNDDNTLGLSILHSEHTNASVPLALCHPGWAEEVGQCLHRWAGTAGRTWPDWRPPMPEQQTWAGPICARASLIESNNESHQLVMWDSCDLPGQHSTRPGLGHTGEVEQKTSEYMFTLLWYWCTNTVSVFSCTLKMILFTPILNSKPKSVSHFKNQSFHDKDWLWQNELLLDLSR